MITCKTNVLFAQRNCNKLKNGTKQITNHYIKLYIYLLQRLLISPVSEFFIIFITVIRIRIAYTWSPARLRQMIPEPMLK